MRTLLAFIFVVFSINAESVELTYGGDFWQGMDMMGFGVGAPFDQSFVCGKTYTFDGSRKFCELKCTNTYCEETCSLPESKEDGAYTLTIEDCSPETVSIYGSNGYSATVTRKEYEGARNNWFIVFLKSVGKFVQPADIIKLEYGVPRTVYREVDGVKQPVRAFEIIGSIQSGTAKNTTGFKLYITNHLEGPQQILFFGFAFEDEFFLKLRGLKWR